jgi:hypothetical protein
MAETQFKLGRIPPNYKPVGTIEPNSDGYLSIKIGAPNKWEFVHKRVWETAHDPIPSGYRIWWKDGNHNNCALENLELLSRPAHMARTTIQKYPESLQEVMRAAAKLRKKLREREDSTNEEHSGRSEAPLVCHLGALQHQEHPMELARAKTISEVAQTIINSAKAEIELLEATCMDAEALNSAVTFFRLQDNKPARSCSLLAHEGLGVNS